MKKYTYISLFSSAGVGCYGFKMEDFECIASSELIEKRLNIQKLNNKCKFESGYIEGDITNEHIKKQIYQEINKWEKLGNPNVDVVIATPPCQGMSVANHKKNTNDINRNSLIRESVNIVKDINPNFFIFENVQAFWKTAAYNNQGELVTIGELINKELSNNFLIHKEVLNLKNYGSNSSRTRTLVIGVNKKYSEHISPIELFPTFKKDLSLIDVIGDLKNLEWGEYDQNDFFHSFRTYPTRMRSWVQGLQEGQSAFENEEDIKKPHRIIDGKLIINKSKNGDKYRRQFYNKVAPCIHTRNDQFASQNTIHPKDDRVFSIRELMRMMTIPDSFQWLAMPLNELNSLPTEEKVKVSKSEEMNIRQSIGEAVPTEVFREIASKIKFFLDSPKPSLKDIKEIIQENNLGNQKNLVTFLKENTNNCSNSTLSMIIEYANTKRKSNSAYFTNKYIIQEIFEVLPDFDKDEILIVEPSVGAGNFLPFIFKKYELIKKVNLKVVDVDPEIIELLKILYSNDRIPNNFNIEFICEDYMNLREIKADLTLGNPPFTKTIGTYRKNLLKDSVSDTITNLAGFFLEKAVKTSDHVSMILPKNLLNTPEYSETRKFLEKFSVENIIDFGEKGFKGILVETINIVINARKKTNTTLVTSITENKKFQQNSSYIFDKKLPYWVIYRNSFFDDVMEKMKFDVFDVFRDRQITNSNTSNEDREEAIRVIKSRNIADDGQLIDIEGYDSFIDKQTISTLAVYKFYENKQVYLTPNITYKPRLIKKQGNYVVNGSVAILIPKSCFEITTEQMQYISSEEFRKFYKIARNYQTRSLNIDKASCFWFGINLEK